jgi:hypothetical protein
MRKPNETRRHPRYRGILTVQVRWGVSSAFGTLYELSEGGAFVEFSPLPPVGTVVSLLIVTDGLRHELRGEVRYRLATEVGPRGLEGVGLSWHEHGPAERALVSRLLERAQAGKPLRS